MSFTIVGLIKSFFRATDAIKTAEKHTLIRRQLGVKVNGINKLISKLVTTNCKLDDKLTSLKGYKNFCNLVAHNMTSMKPEIYIDDAEDDM